MESYPLYWVPGKPRTKRPMGSQFRYRTLATSRDFLLDELKRLGASKIIMSTNIQLRQDGLPYSNRVGPMDTGVAIYFRYNNQDMCFPCDKWNKVHDNMWAIGKTIAAIRGIERWGSKDMMEAAFRGFKALPDYSGTNYFPDVNSLDVLESNYKRLSKELHPDITGEGSKFVDMRSQYLTIRKALENDSNTNC